MTLEALGIPAVDRPPEWYETVVTGFDLETTAPDPRDARIVTWALVNIDSSGRHVLRSRNGLVNPGVDIPEGATAVHGISTAEAQAKGAEPTTALGIIFDALDVLADAELPVVIFNAAYDLTVMLHEAHRHHMTDRAAVITDRLLVVDPLVMDKGIDKYRKGSRKLADTIRHYQVEPPGGAMNWHDASADALAAAALARTMALSFTALKMPAEELHALQRRWAAQQAASLKDYFLRTGKTEAAQTVDGAWPVRTP